MATRRLLYKVIRLFAKLKFVILSFRIAHGRRFFVNVNSVMICRVYDMVRLNLNRLAVLILVPVARL